MTVYDYLMLGVAFAGLLIQAIRYYNEWKANR